MGSDRLWLSVIAACSSGWVKHACYYWLLLAEGHLSRRLFGGMLRLIAALPVPDAVSEPGQKANERSEAIQRRSVSAARQTDAGKTRTAVPQNGQNEPHHHPKEGRAICGLTRQGRRARLSGQRGYNSLN